MTNVVKSEGHFLNERKLLPAPGSVSIAYTNTNKDTKTQLQKNVKINNGKYYGLKVKHFCK